MNEPTKPPKLTEYKNVKKYLVGVVVSFVISQILSFASSVMDVKNVINDPIEYKRSGLSVGLEIASYGVYLVFFVMLALLLVQIVRFEREKKITLRSLDYVR